MLKVGLIVGDRSGPYFHDVHLPVQYFHKYNLLECKIFDHISIDEMAKYDVIFFQRQYAVESLNTILRMQKMGIPTIAHVDDNVWNIQKNNPAFSTYQGDTMARFQEIMSGATAVTTSTNYLRFLCLKYNPNVYIFRNLVETDLLSKLPRADRDKPEEVRIGWTATPHHHDDYVVISHALEEIARKYKNTKFVFMGYMPKEAREMIPAKQLEYYSFIKVEDFYPAFASLDFDIGIAPLTDHPFNWGKTTRKFSEYGIFKIPCILSNVRTYSHLKEYGNVALFPRENRYSGWVHSISELIENTDLRKELAENAYKLVTDHQNIDKFIYERAQVFYDVCGRSGKEYVKIWSDENAPERI